ncbi:MAG: glycosyltransferase family 39 protein [Acidobacteria bacterium]|nr:glycosyltransferase family 39 protein [Acidobacteriota bacterium]
MLMWCAAGALAGVAFTVSPLAVLFALVAMLLWWWAARGLDAWERRWVFGLLGAATGLRVAAVGALLLTTTPAQHFNTYFPDAQFAIARAGWIRNIWLDVPIGPMYEYILYNPYGATSYSYILGAIQMITGPSPYALNFVSIAAFLAGAIALFRIARQSFGPPAALVGLAWLLFWPSTFAWSVSMLKESMQFALAAFLVAFTLRAVRSRTWRARIAAAMLAAATGYALMTLRSAAVYVAVSGAVAGVLAWMLTRRSWVAVTSGVLCVAAGAAVVSRPFVQEQAMSVVRAAADRQIGHVASNGYGYKVLDQRFYSYGSRIARTLEPAEAVRFLGRAAVAFFTVPAPWQIESRSGLAYLPQQMAWYMLVLLGIPGVVAGFRRDPLVTWILLASVAAGVAVIAPNSGNIGTLVRHRDMVVPALALLSAAGFTSVLNTLVPRPD